MDGVMYYRCTSEWCCPCILGDSIFGGFRIRVPRRKGSGGGTSLTG